jgi:BlaI family penicillinase repressor
MGSKEKRESVPRLSDLEWEIVKPLWDNGPMAARDLFRLVPPEQGWAYETVKTMLSRLVKKGVLTYARTGSSYLYSPVYNRDEMTRAATGTFIRRVFDGALRPFLAHYVEQVSDEELQVLRAELIRLSKTVKHKETKS